MGTEIVVVGGGYTGVWAARRILRGLRRTAAGAETRVTVVSTSTTHAFHGWTAEVITGHVRLERTLTPLADLLPGARVMCGTVEAVDLEGRHVVVAGTGGRVRVPYDHLVLGAGSRDATEPVPGLHTHGFTTKGDGELARLIAQLDRAVLRAAGTTDPAERDRLLTVVVAGGGFAGVETAVAVRQRLQARLAVTPALSGRQPRVVLVHRGRHLLPSLRPRFARVASHAEAELTRAGVEVWTATRLAGVTAVSAVIEGGSALAVGTVVSTLGQRPVVLPGTESLPRDVAGRLLVDRSLRVDGVGVGSGVWAGGDGAAVPHPSGSGLCPASALWAIYHGERVGRNVLRSLRGAAPTPFRFPGLGQAASFGVGSAAAELAGVPLLGWSGWLARWVLFHYYMPSRRVALRTLAEWWRTGAQPSFAVSATDSTGSADPLPLGRPGVAA